MNIENDISRIICVGFLFLLGGANEPQFNYVDKKTKNKLYKILLFKYLICFQDNIKNILQNYPGGTSAKQLDHFSQLVYSSK